VALHPGFGVAHALIFSPRRTALLAIFRQPDRLYSLCQLFPLLEDLSSWTGVHDDAVIAVIRH
jgi:hypothetical protein